MFNNLKCSFFCTEWLAYWLAISLAALYYFFFITAQWLHSSAYLRRMLELCAFLSMTISGRCHETFWNDLSSNCRWQM